MKKILIAVAALALCATGAFAKGKYEHSLGAGIAFPINLLKVDDESVTENQVDFDVQWLAIRKSNKLALEANFNIGKASSSDIDIDNVFGLDMKFGIGYAPYKTDQITVAVLGILGYGLSYYEEDPYDVVPVYFKLGVDAVGQYKFTRNLGLFANLGIHYDIGKCQWGYDEPTAYGTIKETDSKDLNGWSIVPALGVSWTF